jgi:ABC-type glycerol-3-phosphate transport system substrate-binding protein
VSKIVLIGWMLLRGLGIFQEAPQTILFWHHYSDERAVFWQGLAEEFNASQDRVRVEVQYFPSYAHQHDAILGALVNGGRPDVVLAQNTDAALYQLSGALVDLTPMLEAEDFYPEFWEQDIFGSERLGIPLSRAAESMYINLTALESMGYETPQTRTELGDIACAYQKISGLTAFEIPLEASALLAMSAPYSFYEDGRFHFDQPALHNTLNFLGDMLRRGCASLNPFGDALTAFASEQTLFYFDSSGARPYVELAAATLFAQPFALGMVPIPAESSPATVWTGSSLSIFHSTPEREAAAWEWVEWLSEPEQTARWVEASGGFPARQDVDFSTERWGAFRAAQVVEEPNIAGYDLIRDELVFAARAVLVGEFSPVRLAMLDETANLVREAYSPMLQ